MLPHYTFDKHLEFECENRILLERYGASTLYICLQQWLLQSAIPLSQGANLFSRLDLDRQLPHYHQEDL